MGQWLRPLVYGSLLLVVALAAPSALATSSDLVAFELPAPGLCIGTLLEPDVEACAPFAVLETVPVDVPEEEIIKLGLGSGVPEDDAADGLDPASDPSPDEGDDEATQQDEPTPRPAPEPDAAGDPGKDASVETSTSSDPDAGERHDRDKEAVRDTRDRAIVAMDTVLTALPDPLEVLAAPVDDAEARLLAGLGLVQDMRLDTPGLPRLDQDAEAAAQPAATTAAPDEGMPVAIVALAAGVAFLGGAALASTGLLGSTLKTLAARMFGPFRRFGWLVAAPLFTKITKADALEHPIRDQLVDTVRQEPGVTVQELRQRFALGYGTIVHHIRLLEHHHILSSVREGRHRRLFVVGSLNHSDRPKAALLANPKTGRIYRLLTDRPGLSQTDLAQEVCVRESTVHWHMNRLQEAGLVESRRRGRKVHYFPLAMATPDIAAA